MRLEREHTRRIEIVATSFVFVSHAESSSNEENSHISKGFFIKSVSKYEPETSNASTSNNGDYVISTDNALNHNYVIIYQSLRGRS